MSLSRRIFYNTLVQTLGKVLAVAIGLTTISLLTQYLREKGFGGYSTVIAFLSLFSVMADLGLYLYVVREISRPGADTEKILSNSFGLRLVGAIATLCIGAFASLLFPYDPIVKEAMFIGIAAYVFTSVNQVFVGIFQKHLVQHLVVITEGTGRAVNLLLVYLFIRRNLSLPYFILALVLGNGVNFFLTFFLAKRYEKFGIAFDLKEWKKILYLSWPLAFSVILNLVYFKTDTIILSIFHSQEAVGIYSLPYKILETLLAFPAMFVGLVMPLLSYHAFATWDRFRRYLQRSFDALLLIDILMVITTLFFARQIVDLLKGQQNYYDSPRLLQILIFAAGTIFMGTLFGYAVVAINKQKEMIKGYLLGAVVGLILYFALIPKFSYWGAAIGTVVTEITVASFAYYLVRQGSGQKISLRILVPASPGIAILLLFYWLVKLPWIPEIILGCMIYTGALILFKAVPAQFINEVIFRE